MSRIVASFLAFAFAAAAGCSAGVGDSGSGEDVSADESGVAPCHTKCKKCPPGKICAMECQQIGNCPGSCSVIALCVEGYSWDDATCSCVPNAGDACGAVTCPSGQVCCNASCGICTPPGGACIQVVCAEST